MNTRRVISECISRGNAEYAFYSAYVSNPDMSSILSGLCESVTPISCTSPYNKLDTKTGNTISADVEKMILEAKNVENQMKLLKEEAKKLEVARNAFQEALKELKEKINDKKLALNENYYRMNELQLLGIINDFNQEYNKKENATATRMEELKAEFWKTVEENMNRFIEVFKEQQRLEAIEAEKRRQEEVKRQLAIQQQKALEAYETKIKAITEWKRKYVSSFLLTKFINTFEKASIEEQKHLLTDPYFSKDDLPSFCTPVLDSWLSRHDHMNTDGFYERDFPRYPGEEEHHMKRGLMRGFSFKQYGSHGHLNAVYDLPANKLADHEPYLVPTIPHLKTPTIKVLVDENGLFSTQRIIHAAGISDKPRVIIDKTGKKEDRYVMKSHVVESSVKGEKCVSLGGDVYYIGDVKNGIPEGYGEVFSFRSYDNDFVGNRISEGFYHDGKLNGEGRLFSNGKVICRGLFENNLFVRGVMIESDTCRYIGEFKNNQLHGTGRLALTNGFWMEGSWIEGKPSGVMMIHMFDFEPIEYDFERSNEYTKVSASMGDDRIAIRLAYSPIGCDCIFYYDGSFFIGQTKDRMLSPVKGDHYVLIGDDYCKANYCGEYEKNNVENVTVLKRFDSGMMQLGLISKKS